MGSFVVPFAYEQEKAGRLVHEVTPIPGLEKTKSNASREAFSAHMDNAFLDYRYRPFWLALAGLVNLMRVATWIFELNKILASIDPAHVANLTTCQSIACGALTASSTTRSLGIESRVA